MKLIKTLAVACAFRAVSAYAVDPVRSETTCADLGEKYAVTAEAKEAAKGFQGTFGEYFNRLERNDLSFGGYRYGSN